MRMKSVNYFLKEVQKWYLYRRLTCSLCLLLCLCFNGYAGDIGQALTLQLKDVTLKEVFQQVEKRSDYRFLYKSDAIGQVNIKNLEVINTSVERILDNCLAGTGLTYEIDGNLIFIKKVSTSDLPQDIEKVKGVVKDTKGEPLPGVAVMIDGTTVGVTTNTKGEFEIAKPSGGKFSLLFTFVGMKPQLIPYKDQDFISVVLEEDIYELDAVNVVETGYGTIDRRHLTSSITSVKAEDILIPGMSSIDQALEGRIPDLVLMSNSGEVGATPRIRVRGTSTILGNREPLWVLDGIVLTDPVNIEPEVLNDPDYVNIIGNAIAGINPQDIERIDVLKDASATAIYGTQAANGVIVVTTKRGRVGKLVVNYNHSSQFTRRPRYTDRNIQVMNSQERVQFSRDLINLHYKFPRNMEMVGYEGAWYDWQSGAISYEEFMRQVKYFETVNTDWFKLLTHDAYSHKHTLSVSGGSEQLRYYASLGYNKDDGVSNSSYVDRYTMMMKVDANITEKFRVNLNVNGNIQKKNHVPSEISAIDYAYNTTRALPAYNDDGSYYYHLTQDAYSIGTSNKFRYNVLNEIENSSNTYDGNTAMMTMILRYDFKPRWNIQVTGSYSRSTTEQNTWWGEKTNYVARLKNGEYEDQPIEGDMNCVLPYGGVLFTTNSASESATLRFQNNFSTYLDANQYHLISSSLGYEINTVKNTASSIERRGFLKDRGLQFIALEDDLEKFPGYQKWLAQGYEKLTNGLTNKISGYLTLSYSFKELFTLNMNGRFDASNKFGSRSNEKLLPIWSVSGMANLKNLFLQNTNWVSEARLRLSYGHQGNMVDGQTPNLLIRQGTMSTIYDMENISTVANLPNPNLKWEQTAQTNIGLDLSFFDGRLNIGGDFYYKKTTDLFTNVSVSPINGISSYVMNNGDMINKGFSVSLNGYPVKTKNFRWYMSTYYSVNLNEVQTDDIRNYTLNDYLNGSAVISGQPISTFYSYKFLGLNPQNGAPMFDDWEDRWHLLKGKTLDEVIPMILANSGTRDPKFSGDLNNTFTYKNWSLSLNFSYSLGSKVRLFEMYGPIMNGVSAATNVRKEFLDRWQVPGDEKNTIYPSIISPSSEDYYRYSIHYSSSSRAVGVNSDIPAFATNVWQMYDDSDLRVVSGNYLKLQSLSFSYRLNDRLLKKTPFTQLQISFSTHNCFTISAKELRGQDPSQAGFADAGLSVRPSYTIGLNVSF